MRYLDKPGFDYKKVFDLCINGIGCSTDRARFFALYPYVTKECDDYISYSDTKDWYKFVPDTSHEDKVICLTVTKKELKKIYTNQLAGKTKDARDVYDYLFYLSPYNKCPFCGFATVETLDHYLPKAYFPFFSVLPINLVPACNKCNKGKSSGMATSKDTQTLHPYFDDVGAFQWLFARIIEKEFIIAEFYLEFPEHISNELKSRIESHFNAYDLADRFSVEAATKLASKRSILMQYAPDKEPERYVREQMLLAAEEEYELHKNSWETALFQALAQSDWYCQKGFRNEVCDLTEPKITETLAGLF